MNFWLINVNIICDLPEKRSLMSTFDVSWSYSIKLNLYWDILGIFSSMSLKIVDSTNYNIAL